MITLFTGGPGSGKTASLVYLLSNLAGDRPVYVHFDPAAKRLPGQVFLHESLKIPHQPIHANEWPDKLPADAILVIDEVQDVWRPRGAATKVPDAIAALETHRHSGIDIFLTTQAPRLVDVNVRSLVGRHVHIRDTGWLGRHWYEWPECNEAMVWKSCPNKKSYKLPVKTFDLYKSATSHSKPIRSTPKVLYWTIGLMVLLVVLAVMAYRIFVRVAPVPEVVAPKVPAMLTAQPSVPVSAPYDSSSFIPRVSNRPESAPAYDHLRVVVAMPQVVGGYCVNSRCKCLTSQGTDAGLSDRECATWIERRPFDPYRVAVVASALPTSPAMQVPSSRSDQPLTSGSPGSDQR